MTAAASSQTIALDCAPGRCRPDEVLRNVIQGTGLSIREASLRIFGCWTFDYSDVPASAWQNALPTIEERIRSLHASGVIRYGSWS